MVRMATLSGNNEDRSKEGRNRDLDDWSWFKKCCIDTLDKNKKTRRKCGPYDYQREYCLKNECPNEQSSTDKYALAV